MPTLLVFISLFIGILSCSEPGNVQDAAHDPINSPSHQAPAYPILIAPGLLPSRTPQHVVGTVPGPFGVRGVSGHVSEVEQVAFIRTCQLRLIDPRVSPPEETTVWYVRFSGTFHLSLLGYVDQPPNHEAYYLVSDRTGAVLQRGTFSLGSAHPETPEPGRLTSGCS